MCTPGDAAANGKGIGSIGDGHSENREVQVARFRVLFAFFAFFCADTCMVDKQGVEGVAPKQPPEQPTEGAMEEAPKQAAEEVPKEEQTQPLRQHERRHQNSQQRQHQRTHQSNEQR